MRFVFNMFKGQVKGHARKLKSGKVVYVNPFETKREKQQTMFEAETRGSKVQPSLFGYKKPEKKEPDKGVEAAKRVIDESKGIETDDKKISKLIKTATPETRNEVTKDLFGTPSETESITHEKKDYKFLPEVVTDYDFLKKMKLTAAFDFTGVDLKNVGIVPKRNIDKKPDWIPVVDPGWFKNYAKYRLPCIKIEDNKYIAMIGKDHAIITSPEVIIATDDYYKKLRKEEIDNEHKIKVGEFESGERNFLPKKERLTSLKRLGWTRYDVELWEKYNNKKDSLDLFFCSIFFSGLPWYRMTSLQLYLF